MTTAPTDICLTIDTEFSINGAFAHPDRCAPLGKARVHCPVDGEDQGLGFLAGAYRRLDGLANLATSTADRIGMKQTLKRTMRRLSTGRAA